MAVCIVCGDEAAHWKEKTYRTRLNAEIGKALKAQDARDQFINIGFDPIPGTPAQFAAYIREETTKWSRVIRQSGAKLD